MPFPWLQVVRMVPSIVSLSRDILKRTQKPDWAPAAGLEGLEGLEARVRELEALTRRQAELGEDVARQLALLADAVTRLRRLTISALLLAAAAAILAALALTLAAR